MRALHALLIAAVFLAIPAHAAPREVERALPGAQQVGAAEYRVLTLPVFDAGLWSETGAFSWSEDFALTLTYRRAFTASALAARSIAEMERAGAARATLAPLQARLEGCFADVGAGDRITGVSTGPDSARFYLNGRQTCTLSWPGFRRGFFGIWLARQDAFAARLTGRG